MKSVMTHQFSKAPQAQIQRSRFNRSSGRKSTFDAGWLVPVYCDEALPGDTFELKLTAFARMSTPIFPVMDNLYLETQFFAVPIRLLWENWERFNGAQDNPADLTDFLIPEMTSPTGAGVGYSNESLSDYFGIPTKIGDLVHSSLWHRAYNLIYNEWYRDQNLQDSVVVDLDDGPDDPADYVLLRRGKRHDYFTSCLPWPQKGPAVSMPLGEKAAIATDQTNPNRVGVVSTTQGDLVKELYSDPLKIGGITVPSPGELYADMTSVTSATINQLRQAFQLQKLYERDARGGTRYTEIIRSHFGVSSPDERLQRPEYLGGGSSAVNVSAIAQTSSTDVVTPQGNLAAIGTVGVIGHGFTKSFTEHCVLIGIASVRADLTYQQGLPRMFSRSTRWDFYWPALAHIGEQAVLNQEIYAQDAGGTPAENFETFGYQERFAEYRYKNSEITGKFRSNDATSLDPWHLSQEFGSLPVLDDTFIKDTPPVDRVIAVNTEPHFIYDSFISLHCTRPMPLYSVPGLIDHF